MSEKRFSIAESVRFGLYMMLDHFGMFLAVAFIYFGIMLLAGALLFILACLPFVGTMMQAAKMSGIDVFDTRLFGIVFNQLGYGFSLTLLLASFVFFAVNRYLKLGFTKISLNIYDKNSSTLAMLFSCYPLILKDAVASCLYFLICFIGYCLLIVPGIYCTVTYGFYHQFIVDKNAGILESFTKSAEITRGAKWELFAVSILFLLIRLFSVKLFGITLFFVWLFFSLVTVYIYRRLVSLKRI